MEDPLPLANEAVNEHVMEDPLPLANEAAVLPNEVAVLDVVEFKPASTCSFTGLLPQNKCESVTALQDRVVTYEELWSTTDEQEQNRPEAFFIYALLLMIKIPVENDVRPFGTAVSALNNSKKAKTTETYKRMYTFADLTDGNGRLFVVLDRMKSDTDIHWQYDRTREGVAIGEKFAIKNPIFSSRLSNDVPILELRTGFILLTRPQIPEIVRSLKQNTENDMRFFCFRAAKVRATQVNVVNTICNHTMCDRQSGNIPKPCGCFHVGSRGRTKQPSVLEMVLKIMPSDHTKLALNDDELKITGKKFSSFRTSSFFFQATQLPDLSNFTMDSGPVRGRIISRVEAITHEISELRGGWTVCGWFKRGSTKDISSEGQVAAESVSYNIIYCYPTIATKNVVYHSLITFDEMSEAVQIPA